MERQADGVDAEIAAVLEDAGDEGRVEHPRAGPAHVEIELQPSASLGIEEARLGRDLPSGVLGGRVVEHEVGVFFEPGRARREADADVELEVRGRRSVEPLAGDGGLEGQVLAPQDLARHPEVDLEPVGDDGLDLEGLAESQPAHEDAGLPVAGRGGLVRRGPERVERLDGPFRPQGPHEPALRRIELHADGVARRQDLVSVEEDEGQVEGVAGAPDAALAVDRALEALLDGLPADVEMAHRQGRVVAHSEIADVVARLGRDIVGRIGELEDGEAVGVADRLAEGLVLEVEGPHPDPGQGLGRADVGGHDVQRAGRLALGDQPDVGGQEIAADGGLGVVAGIVIGVVARVVAAGPVPMSPGISFLGVIPVRIAVVSFALLVAERGLLDDGLVARGAGIGRVAPVEGQDEAEEAARVLPEQVGHVEVVARDAARDRRVIRQRDRLAPEIAPDSGQLFAPAELVDLQELGHVAAEDLEGRHLDGPQIDGLEGHGQAVLARQDGALADEPG